MPAKHQPGCPCQGCGQNNCCQANCAPCKLPQKDLQLVINASGNTSTLPLRYLGTNNWATDCIFNAQYGLRCQDGFIAFTYSLFPAPGCAGEPVFQCSSLNGPIPPTGFYSITSVCSPLKITIIDQYVGTPPLGTYYCSPDNSNPSYGPITFTITDPNPAMNPPGLMCQKVIIYCCGPNVLPGAIVTIYNQQGGMILASGTMPTSGGLNLAWQGKSGTYWITVTSNDPLFENFAGSFNLSCGGTTSFGLTPVSGYQCCYPCCDPLPESIQFTDSVLVPGGGNAVYQTSGFFQGSWVYSQSITFPANPPFCDGGTVPVWWVMTCDIVGAGSFPGSIDIAVWVPVDNGNTSCPNGVMPALPMRYIQHTPVQSCTNTFSVSQLYVPSVAGLAFSALYSNAPNTTITFSQ